MMIDAVHFTRIHEIAKDQQKYIKQIIRAQYGEDLRHAAKLESIFLLYTSQPITCIPWFHVIG